MSSLFGPKVAEIQERPALENQNIIIEYQNLVAMESDTSDNTNNNPEGTPPKVQENNVPETENLDQDNAVSEQPVVVVNPVIQLTANEQKKLIQLEDTVNKAESEGWIALAKIKHFKDGAWWNRQFDSFDKYVASKFDYHPKHCVRLVEAGGFLVKLADAKTKAPRLKRESHIREIIQKLPESHHVTFWDKYCADHAVTEETISEVTAKDIKAAVTEYRKQIPEDELPVKAPREKKVKIPVVEKIRTKSLSLVAKVKDLVQELPERDAIELKLEELEDLLNA